MEFLQQFLSAPFDFLVHYGLPFVIVLSILVFVHEWGHYIVARMCGVKVETFSIGFGREIFGFNDKNGTRWKFSIVPLGGYVQMFGDSDPASAGHDESVEGKEGKSRKMTAAEKKVAFYNQSLPKRSAIVVAGPAINFIFAIILLAGLYTVYGQPYVPPVAASLIADGPAERAGIQPDDKIVAINGNRIENFQDIVTAVAVNLDQELDVTVVSMVDIGVWDEANPTTLTMIPERKSVEDRFGFKHSKGLIGVVSPQGKSEVNEHSVLSATGAAVKETWGITTSTLKALGQMIMGVRSPEELGGILRIGAYAGEFAQAGIVSLITFTALLSVNLGLINLFPIPMLDGGHLAMYGVEALKGSPLNARIQEYAFRTGFAAVVFFMLFATWNDLVQLRVIDYLKNIVS